MKLGFTGTREGMSEWQHDEFLELLVDVLIPKYGPITEFHHGDCIGADADAHRIIQARCPECCIVAHPCTFEELRAYTKATQIRSPLDSKTRNQNIVLSSSVLLACPLTDVPGPSGTWQTINMALRANREVYILYSGGGHKHQAPSPSPKGLFR